MQWNYHKIMYFLKVAEILNFSRAAKELFISPQALNKQILQLELEQNSFYRTFQAKEKEYAFDYHMTAFYRPDNHFFSLFENLQDVVEESILQIKI